MIYIAADVEKYIEKSIDSLMNQSIGFEKLQIILIDDNSTDQSAEIIRRYEKKYDNIFGIYLTQNSHAAGKPRNEGLDIASGECVMFLDPDDMYEKNACEILYRELNEGGYDCVAGYYKEIDENDNIVNENAYSVMEIAEGVYDIENDLENVLKLRSGFWAKIYKRDLIEKLKLRFPEDVPGQDLVFFINYLLNGKKLKYVDKPVVFYRLRNKKNKSISFLYNEWFFLGISKSYKMCLEIFQEKKVADKFEILFKGALDFYIRCMIDSNLEEEVIAHILSEWQWAYDYETFQEQSEKDFWYGPVSKLLLNKEYDKAANVICQLRSLRKWNNELKEAVEWHKSNSESLQKQIDELKGWITQLEEARDYYKIQMENRQIEYEKLKLEFDGKQDQNDMYDQIEKEAKKWKYKYNNLISDTTIQKIAKKKKIDI